MTLSTPELAEMADNLFAHAAELGSGVKNKNTMFHLKLAATTIRDMAGVQTNHPDLSIKQLQWQRHDCLQEDMQRVDAATAFGSYIILYDIRGASLYFEDDNRIGDPHWTLSGAKYAAQAHFDAGLRASLATFPAAQPTLYLGRAPAGEWSSGRVEIMPDHMQAWLDKGYDCEPYFSAPQSLASETEAKAWAALEASRIAIDDWLNLYAPDFCNEARVAEARERTNARGTLAYIADVQQANREAIALLKPATEEANK